MKKVFLSCLLALSLCLVLGLVLSSSPVQAEIGFAGGESVRGGGPCGSVVCDPGTYCCNASCSRCVPFGYFCTQEVCPPVE